MTPKRHTLLAVVSLAILLLSSGIGLASPAAQRQPAAIRLKAAQFVPGRGERPALRAALAAAAAPEGRNSYYLVQFSGPVEQSWKDQVTAAGAELLDYVPDFTFKARMTPAVARQIEQLGNVAYVGAFHPGYKLSPDLVREGTHIFKVRIERGADAAQAAAAIAGSGVQVLGREQNILLVAANATQLDAIAQVLDVAWVQNFAVFQKHNQYGGGVIMGSNTANAAGYNGSTQIAAVADTGIGGGTAATAHVDIPASRVTAVQNFAGAAGGCFQTVVNDGAVDVDSGHGTHVAGSVLSDGGAAGEGKGVAPAASLVFQAIENYATVKALCASLYGYTNGYYLTGIPADLNTLFQQAYNAGARVHANSWGSAVDGDYTLDSANADKFVWNNRDMAITFSAGNDGVDANNDGVVDNDSIGSPATAKNVITIGASENDRNGDYACDTNLTYTSHDAYQPGQTCTSMSGQNLLGTAARWDFNTAPLVNDPTAGNQDQMAAFSSRGPTDDGRIKPDVVAPGSWILSTYSSMHQEGYGDPVNPKNGAYQSDGWGMPYNEYYKYFGGTSMSNPLAAGAAVVVRDYYNKAKSYTSPSAALVKATLINSAVDMLDENNDGANDNDFPIPNTNEGWGRINVASATDGSIQYLDQKTGIATNGTSNNQVSVTTSGPLKVSLVWSDYQSTETATQNLVNDLDLVVTSPTGTIYRGNVFSGGWSATGGSADRVNNVENVYVQSAGTGNWTVEVKGFNVPNGPQPFALVVDGGALSTVTPPTPTAPAAPTSLAATVVSRNQINLSWTDNANNEDGFKIERCAGSTCTNFVQVATVGANVTSYSNTGLTRNTTYRYRVRAYNTGGDSAYSNIVNATTLR